MRCILENNVAVLLEPMLQSFSTLSHLLASASLPASASLFYCFIYWYDMEISHCDKTVKMRHAERGVDTRKGLFKEK